MWPDINFDPINLYNAPKLIYRDNLIDWCNHLVKYNVSFIVEITDTEIILNINRMKVLFDKNKNFKGIECL